MHLEMFVMFRRDLIIAASAGAVEGEDIYLAFIQAPWRIKSLSCFPLIFYTKEDK